MDRIYYLQRWNETIDRESSNEAQIVINLITADAVSFIQQLLLNCFSVSSASSQRETHLRECGAIKDTQHMFSAFRNLTMQPVNERDVMRRP